MKIVCKDNYARDSVADWLVCDNIKSERLANIMCEALQAQLGGENSFNFFCVVSDNYKLWGGLEELI